MFYHNGHSLAILWSLLILLSTTIQPTRASDETLAAPILWETVTDQDWQIDSTWLEEPAAAVMLFERVTDDDRLLYDEWKVMHEYTRTRILSPAGLAKCTKSFDYTPRLDLILNIGTRTIMPDGRIFEQTKQKILASAKPIPGASQSRTIDVTFPHADSNCIVEYCVVVKIRVADIGFTYADRTIQKDIPLLTGEYTWYPANPVQSNAPYNALGKAHFAWCGASESFRKTAVEQVSREAVKVTVHNVPAWAKEPLALPDSTSRTQLWRYYSNNESNQDAWRAISDDYLSSPRLAASDKDLARIDKEAERFRSITGRDETIKAVYTWLQDSLLNTSYYPKPPANFLKAIGRSFSSFQAQRDLSSVLKNHYGNWQQIEAIFYHLLRALDIDAYPVLVTGRQERVFVTEAGIWQFNRSIIAIKEGQGQIRYFAPGEVAMPCGKLHWSLEQVPGLLCERMPSIVTIPFSSPDENKVVRVFNLNVLSDLTVSGEMVEQHNGHKGRLCKTTSIIDGATQVTKLLTDSLKQLIPGVKGYLLRATYDSSSTTPVIARYKVRYDSISSTSSGDLILAPFLYAPDSDTLFRSTHRAGDLSFAYAYSTIDSVKLDLARDLNGLALPLSTLFENGAGRCEVNYAIQGNQLVATRIFILNKPLFPVEEYASVRELFAVRATTARQLIQLPSI